MKFKLSQNMFIFACIKLCLYFFFLFWFCLKQTGKKERRDKVLVSRVKIRVVAVEDLSCDKNGLKGPDGKHVLF